LRLDAGDVVDWIREYGGGDESFRFVSNSWLVAVSSAIVRNLYKSPTLQATCTGWLIKSRTLMQPFNIRRNGLKIQL